MGFHHLLLGKRGNMRGPNGDGKRTGRARYLQYPSPQSTGTCTCTSRHSSQSKLVSRYHASLVLGSTPSISPKKQPRLCFFGISSSQLQLILLIRSDELCLGWISFTPCVLAGFPNAQDLPAPWIASSSATKHHASVITLLCINIEVNATTA